MKALKFKDAQKAFILRQGEDGMPVSKKAEGNLERPSDYFEF